jgi:hypothetical protein
MQEHQTVSPFTNFHTKKTLKERNFFDEPATPAEHCPLNYYVRPCPPKLRREWLANWALFHKK